VGTAEPNFRCLGDNNCYTGHPLIFIEPMFSLLITIVSVALVAALAIATIFYGGEAYRNGKTRAVATSAITQGQQLLAAAELFRVHKGRWPLNSQELIDANYLKSVPEPVPNIAGTAARAEWTQVQEGAPAYWVLRNVSESVCREINQQVRGDNGIYNAAVAQLSVQCFGQNSNFTALVHLPPKAVELELSAIVPANGGTPLLEVDPTGNGWSRQPKSSNSVAPVVPALGPDGRYYDAGTDEPLSTLAFSDTAVGSTSTQTVKVINVGTSDLALESPPVAVTAPFAVAGATCPSVLPAGQYCTIGLTFSPQTVGTASQSMVLRSNATAARSLLLAGNGMGQATVASFAPTSISPAAGQAIVVSGTNFVEGTVAAINGTPVSTVVNNAKSLTLTTPSLAAGSYALTVTVPYANVAQLATPLQVVAPAPTIEVQDGSNTKVSTISFPQTKVGRTSAVVSYNLVNKGAADLTFGATPIVVSPPFSLASTTCSGTLAPNGACAIDMAFTPTSETTYSGNYLTVNSNVSNAVLPTLSGVTAPPGLDGTVTFIPGGTDRLTVGPDSQTIYYITRTGNPVPVWLYSQVEGGTAVGHPVSFTDTCRTQPNADADETFRPIDVAYDNVTSSLFVSGECRGARTTFHPIQLLKVNLGDFTGSIVYTLAKPTTQISGQSYGFLSANKTGGLALSHYNGAIGFRTRDNQQSWNNINYSGADYALVLKDRAPGASTPETLIWAYAYNSRSEACVNSTCGLSARGPVIGRDMAANGEMITVDQYGVTKNVMTYKADGSFSSQGSQVFVVSLSSYALGSSGKIVVAADGTIFGWSGSKGMMFHVQ
jgi:hypothetical protein